MRIVVFILLVFQALCVFCKDCNVAILLDRSGVESATSQDINLMHQLVSALEQKTSVVITSASLFYNVMKRRDAFAKGLHTSGSLQQELWRLYQTTNNRLQQVHGNVQSLTMNLNAKWYKKKFFRLAQIPVHQLDQLKFNFFCYQFLFDTSFWKIRELEGNILVFIPADLTKKICAGDDISFSKAKATKKKNVTNPLPALMSVLKTKDMNWSIYLVGHGDLAYGKNPGVIAGCTVDQFNQLLQYLDTKIRPHLLIYASCFSGGVHTVEPYQDMQLQFPVIVLASTDAPTYVFGNVAGVKLPPYDQFNFLLKEDVGSSCQLSRVPTSNFANIKRVYKNNQVDIKMLRTICPFYYCDTQTTCFLEKIENLPLVRYPKSSCFVPVKEVVSKKLAACAHNHVDEMIADKAVLLYTHYLKKLQIPSCFFASLVSMLPGLHTHSIEEIDAKKVGLKDLLQRMFFAIDAMQYKKSFMIQKIVCQDDLTDFGGVAVFHDVMILQDDMFMPFFIDDYMADAAVYLSYQHHTYLLLYKDNELVDIRIVQGEKLATMLKIQNILKQSVEYGLRHADNVSHQAYKKHAAHQANLIAQCKKQKICRP